MTAEDIIRREARYFKVGKWPEVLIESVGSDLFKFGDEVIIAIIPAPGRKR